MQTHTQKLNKNNPKNRKIKIKAIPQQWRQKLVNRRNFYRIRKPSKNFELKYTTSTQRTLVVRSEYGSIRRELMILKIQFNQIIPISSES